MVHLLWLLVPVVPLVALVLQPNMVYVVTQTPVFYLVLITSLAASWWLVGYDKWLGLFLTWFSLRTIGVVIFGPGQQGLAFERLQLVTYGVVAMLLISQLSSKWHPWIFVSLLVAATSEVFVVVWQQFEPFVVWQDATFPSRGLLGSDRYVAMFLGIIAPLAPLWLLPVMFVGLFITKSLVCLAAVFVGLSVRFKQYKLLMIGFVCVLIVWLWRGLPLHSFGQRLWVLNYSLSEMSWWHWLLGVGSGQWNVTIPAMENELGHSSVFVWAHNEFLLVFFELGAVGLGLLLMWLWSKRRMFSTQVAGALVALAIISFFWFPFELGNIAWPAIIVLGLGLAQQKEVPLVAAL